MATEKLMADFKKRLELHHKRSHHKGNLIITKRYESKARKEEGNFFNEVRRRGRQKYIVERKDVWEGGLTRRRERKKLIWR